MKKSIFYILGATLLLVGCGGGRDYYDSDDKRGAVYNEQTKEYITDKNEFASTHRLGCRRGCRTRSRP